MKSYKTKNILKKRKRRKLGSSKNQKADPNLEGITLNNNIITHINEWKTSKVIERESFSVLLETLLSDIGSNVILPPCFFSELNNFTTEEVLQSKIYESIGFIKESWGDCSHQVLISLVINRKLGFLENLEISIDPNELLTYLYLHTVESEGFNLFMSYIGCVESVIVEKIARFLIQGFSHFYFAPKRLKRYSSFIVLSCQSIQAWIDERDYGDLIFDNNEISEDQIVSNSIHFIQDLVSLKKIFLIMTNHIDLLIDYQE